MRPEETEKALRHLLKSRGKTLKSLLPNDVLEIATNFWQDAAVDGIRDSTGDGLVAYFELMDRGRGAFFEFGVNRIMTPQPASDDYSAWLKAFKLGITVSFKPTVEVFQLSPVADFFACWERTQVQSFIDEIEASPQFKIIAASTPHSSRVRFKDCSSPWGEPRHPTQGLTWAIG